MFFAIYFPILFAFLLFINLYYLEGIPHVPDSVAYLFIAKMFAMGHVIMPIPVSPEHFNFFTGILSIEQGKWLFQYPFGHPLLLMIGVLLGFPSIIPPLIGTISVLLLFLIAKKLFDLKTAFFLAFLPILSPFFLENASSFMSHNTAAFYLIFSFYLLILLIKHPRMIYALFSGIFLGLLFNTRPLTSLPFIAIFVLTILVKQKNLPSKISSVFFFIIGLGIMFSLWSLYNFLTTGEPFTSQYYLINKGMLSFPLLQDMSKFISSHSKNFIVLFNNSGPMIFNWPLFITYSILIIPFALRKHTFWDGIFFISLLALPIVYFFYDGQFLMYGPRFWYESLPFVFLLTSRGLSVLFNYYPKITVIIFIIFAIISLNKLFGIIPTKDPDMMSPLSLERLKGINGVDNRIADMTRQSNIHNAVIFIKDCGAWWCYGSVFSKNSPTLNTDIIYAKDLGNDKNISIVNYFKNRSFYKFDYYQHQLTPISYRQ